MDAKTIQAFNDYVNTNGLRKYGDDVLTHYVCMMEHEAEASLMAQGILQPSKAQYRAAVRDTFKHSPSGNYPDMADPFAYTKIPTPVPDDVVAKFMQGYDRGFDLSNYEDGKIIADYISSSSTM